MTENTLFDDRTREIGVGEIFISGRQIIRLPAGVEGNGGLEEMSAYIREIAGGMSAGANDVGDAKVNGLSLVLPTLPISRRGGMHGDF